MPKNEWAGTLWSEARQVAALNDWPATPGDDGPPADHYHALRSADRDQEAALFLAQALSRYDSVAWARAEVTRVPQACPPEAKAALDAVDAWLKEPNERARQAAGDAAGPIDPPSPATLCALAVFYSGGSIAPAAQPPVTPHRGATGRFAGTAIIAATGLADDPAAALAQALDDGEHLARGTTDRGASC